MKIYLLSWSSMTLRYYSRHHAEQVAKALKGRVIGPIHIQVIHA